MFVPTKMPNWLLVHGVDGCLCSIPSKHVSLVEHVAAHGSQHRHPVNSVKDSSMHTVVIAGMSHTKAHMKPRFAEKSLGTALAGTGRREMPSQQQQLLHRGVCLFTCSAARAAGTAARAAAVKAEIGGMQGWSEHWPAPLGTQSRHGNALCWCGYCCHEWHAYVLCSWAALLVAIETGSADKAHTAVWQQSAVHWHSMQGNMGCVWT